MQRMSFPKERHAPSNSRRLQTLSHLAAITIDTHGNQLPIQNTNMHNRVYHVTRYTWGITPDAAPRQHQVQSILPVLNVYWTEVAESCVATNNQCSSHPLRHILATKRKKRDPKKNEEKIYTKRKSSKNEENFSNRAKNRRKELNASCSRQSCAKATTQR